MKIVSKIIFLLYIGLFFNNCSSSQKFQKDNNFSYQDIYKQKYNKGKGGMIDLTVENGENFSGSITPDNQYMFYAGNNEGSFNIYMRPLTNITSIPVIPSATNQVEPAISPNGKRLAFVDDELDPEGDITILNLNPSLIEKLYFTEGKAAIEREYAGKKVFLTNNIKSPSRARDSSPVWSPDGKWIAFTSNRTENEQTFFGPAQGSLPNIWIINSDNPSILKQITQNGAIMPVFSPDGSKIAYVDTSRPETHGDIHEINISSGEDRQITFGNDFDINPLYINNETIGFVRISKDTNNDGLINYRDKGQLLEIALDPDISKIVNPSQKLTPLITTLENIFNARYSNFLNGTIIFAHSEGENINLAFIPASGIVPRKESSLDQYSYAQMVKQESTENFIISLEAVKKFHANDPLSQILIPEAEFEEFNYLTGSEKQEKASFIKNKIDQGEIYYNILLDLYTFDHLTEKEKLSAIAPALISSDSRLEYLEKINQFPPSLFQDHTLSDLQKSKLMSKYYKELKTNGSLTKAAYVRRQILLEYPDYYENIHLLLEASKNTIISDIPEELLFILYPKQIKLYTIVDTTDDNTDSKESGKKINLSKLSELITSRNILDAENIIYDFFLKLYKEKQNSLIEQILLKYDIKNFKKIHLLSSIASSNYFLAINNLKEASLQLEIAATDTSNKGKWLYEYLVLSAKILEKVDKKESAFENYYKALLTYENIYEEVDIEYLVSHTVSFYEEKAKYLASINQFDESWEAYKKLYTIYLYLYPRAITPELVQQKSLNTFMQLNDMILTLKTSHASLQNKVIDFYNENIPVARKYLMNSFIFGRAHLYTLLGIDKHKSDEKNFQLTKESKEKIFKLFKAAQTDLQWSIYADSSFSDSTILLGWLYQFIDNKRESYFKTLSGKTLYDKEYFADLYKIYFPDYLYEENIKLFKRSLAFSKTGSNQQSIQSFYLNLANNYFLLNNYPKAAEFYQKIDIDKTSPLHYKFETPLQEAQYNFHAGKSFYYISRFKDCDLSLNRALDYYRKLNDAQEENKINSENSLGSKQIVILKYLALNGADARNYENAIAYYDEILILLKKEKNKNENDLILLEMARLNLLRAQENQKPEYLKATLGSLKKAQAALDRSDLILAPTFPWTVKIFGLLNIRFYKWSSDDANKGDNRLSFLLPTLNKYQYLYSLYADAYRLTGDFEKSASSLKKLKDYANDDNTKHGNIASISTEMRLGEIYFLLKKYNLAKISYEEALSLSEKFGQLDTFSKAQKNLLAIACIEIEQNKNNPVERLKLINDSIKNLSNFQTKYEESKMKIREAEIKSKNKGLSLSNAEKIVIKKKAIADIYKILLYRGVFLTYKSETMAVLGNQEKSKSFTAYIQQKDEMYKIQTESNSTLSGNISITPTEKINLLDKSRDRKLIIHLAMNNAYNFEINHDYKAAMEEYEKIYYRASEFAAAELTVISGFKLYETRLLNNSPNPMESLNNVLQILQSNPALLLKYSDIYSKISVALIDDLLKKRKYLEAIHFENSNRMFKINPVIREYLSDPLSPVQAQLKKYTDLERTEQQVKADMEKLLLRKESVSLHKNYLAQIKEQKTLIQTKMQSSAAYEKYALALFPELFEIKTINNINYTFAYLCFTKQGLVLMTSPSPFPSDKKINLKTYNITLSEIEKFSTSLQIPGQEGQIDWKLFSKDMHSFYNQVNSLKVDVIFLPDELLNNSFASLIKHQAITDYTLQSAGLFQANSSFIVKNWGIFNEKRVASNEKPGQQPTFITIKKPSDITDNYNLDIIETQLPESFYNTIFPLFSTIINSNQNFSSIIINYNQNQTRSKNLLTGASNLLMALSNVSSVIHYTQSKQDAMLPDFFTGTYPNQKNFLFSGNIEILKSWLNTNTASNAPQYITHDYNQCVKNLEKNYTIFSETELLNTITYCQDTISFIDHFPGKVINNKEKLINDLLLWKMKVFIEHKKENEAIGLMTSLSNDSPYKKNNTIQLLNELYKNGYSDKGRELYNQIKVDVQLSEPEEQLLIESYYIFLLKRGELAQIAKPWEFNSDSYAFKVKYREYDIWTDKIKHLIENSKNKIQWITLLLENNEVVLAWNLALQYDVLALLNTKYKLLFYFSEIASIESINKISNDPLLIKTVDFLTNKKHEEPANDIPPYYKSLIEIKRILDSFETEKPANIQEMVITFLTENAGKQDISAFQNIIALFFRELENKANSEIKNQALLKLLSEAGDIENKFFGKNNAEINFISSLYGKSKSIDTLSQALIKISGEEIHSTYNNAQIEFLSYLTLMENPEKLTGYKQVISKEAIYKINESSKPYLTFFLEFITSFQTDEFSFNKFSWEKWQYDLIATYLVNTKQFDELLKLYAFYDSGKDLDLAQSHKNISGWITVNKNFYTWDWAGTKINFSIMQQELIADWISKQKGFIYISRKDQNLQKVSPQYLFGKLFSTDIIVPEKPETTSDYKTIWSSSGSSGHHSPLHSMVYVELGENQDTLNNSIKVIGISQEQNNLNKVFFYDETFDLDSFQARVKPSGAYHIVMIGNKSYQSYLKIADAYIKKVASSDDYNKLFMETINDFYNNKPVIDKSEAVIFIKY